MIATLKNNRSLSFYQNVPIMYSNDLSASSNSSINSILIAGQSAATARTTTNFYTQLNDFLADLNAKKAALAKEVAEGLSNNPAYKSSRNNGVGLAWKYEEADVKMGGKGSAPWNEAQRQELKTTGKVRGQEGHHINNVADHPEDQGNPDNIEFLDREKHKARHGGSFRNESHGPHIDKDKMLKRTNAMRVFKNELTGIALATAIGAGIGFTIGFAVSLAQNGVSSDSIKNAFAAGGKAGLQSGVLSALSYGVGRTVGQLAVKAMQGVLENAGITVTENISTMCSMGAVGFMTIVIFSAYEFIKLKRMGVASKDAIIKVGKQALFSLSLLALAIAAQGIWGGSAGLIVSISSGIILITINIVQIVLQRENADKIKIYVIEQAKPLYSAA